MQKPKQWLGTMARLHTVVATVINTIIMVIKQIKDNLTNNEQDDYIGYLHGNMKLQA